MVYVYAVAADLADLTNLAGVQGEPLTLVPFTGGVAIVGEVGARPTVDPATLHAQDTLVRALHERAGALLPMRFGTASSDREEVMRALQAHGDLATRLATVRGCEQMVMRVLGAGPTPDAPVSGGTTGTEYLEARARRHRPAPALETLAAGLENMVKAVKIEPSNQPGMLGAVYHLLERGRADDYRRVVDRLAAGVPAVRVLVSGPSPPYAFA
jgi:hypothetical protein